MKLNFNEHIVSPEKTLFAETYSVTDENGELVANNEPHDEIPFKHDLCKELVRRYNSYDETQKFLKTLSCPKAAGFEGPETFPDCGECLVCKARLEIAENS